MWKDDLIIYIYRLPYNEQILKAHGAFMNSEWITPEQTSAVQTVYLMLRQAKELNPTEAISCEEFSFVIICGVV